MLNPGALFFKLAISNSGEFKPSKSKSVLDGVGSSAGIGAGVGAAVSGAGNALMAKDSLRNLINPAMVKPTMGGALKGMAGAGISGARYAAGSTIADNILPKATSEGAYGGDKGWNDSLVGSLAPSGIRGLGTSMAGGFAASGVPGAIGGAATSAVGSVGAIGKNIYQKWQADRENAAFPAEMQRMEEQKQGLLQQRANNAKIDMERTRQGTNPYISPSAQGSSLGLASGLNKFSFVNTTVPIDMRPVQSSNILSIGYHSPSKTLQVNFKGKNTTQYRYSDVSPQRFRAFAESKSKGKYFNKAFRRLKEYQKLARFKANELGSCNAR